MNILKDYRHCWKGLHVYLKTQRQCPHCQRGKSVPTCKLPPHLKICRKGLHLYSIKDIGCKYCDRQRASEWYKNNPLRHLENTKNGQKIIQKKEKKYAKTGINKTRLRQMHSLQGVEQSKEKLSQYGQIKK